MIASSLKTSFEVIQVPPSLLPKSLKFENYTIAFKMAPFVRYFINTIIVTVLSIISTVIIAILSAFAFANLEFKGRDLMFAIFLASMMIPGEVLIVTNFKTISNLGWIDTYRALFVPYMANVLYIYMLREFFLTVPKQLYYAAKVDGANRFTTLMKITVPLISPMLSYLIITGFIGGFKAYTAVVGIYGAEKVSNSYINTMVGYIYDQIGNDSTGLAAAGSLILFGIILVFTLINLAVSKKKVHY